MREKYRLSFPIKGWAYLSWPLDVEHSEPVRRSVAELAEIPGVNLVPHQIQIPRNALSLDEAHGLFERTAVVINPPLRELCSNWTSLRKLYPHQSEAVRFARENNGMLLADEMGTGKTLSAIVAAESYCKETFTDRARLIIAPKFTRAVWLNELKAAGAILDDSEFCALESRNLDHPCWRVDAKWYFIHYDVVKTWWSRFSRLGSRKPAVVILDEIHWLKNSRTQRSKGALMAAGPVPLRIGLTGTPMANRPAELWNPLSIITGPKTWGHIIDWRKRYCGAVHNGFGFEDTGPTNTEELQERLQTCYLRRTADDVGLDLPSMSRQVIECDMDAASKMAHDRLIEDCFRGDVKAIIRAVMEGRAGRDTLSLLASIRKITSFAKFRTTVDYVQNVLDQGESVVVFTWMREMAEKIGDAFRNPKLGIPVHVVHGGISQGLRDESVERFQTHGGLLVSTIDALKEGVTLHRARLVVLHDLDWVPSNVLQCEKRVHRIGQHRPVMASWIVARDSIDVILAKILIAKAEAMKDTLGIDAAVNLVDELDLANVVGLASFEDEVVDMMTRWRSR